MKFTLFSAPESACENWKIAQWKLSTDSIALCCKKIHSTLDDSLSFGAVDWKFEALRENHITRQAWCWIRRKSQLSTRSDEEYEERGEPRRANSKMRELCYASTELGRSTLQQVFFPHLFFAVEHFQSLTSYAFRLRLDVCSDDDDEHTIWRSKPSALFQYRISARRLWVSLRFPPLVSTVAVYIISFVSLSLCLLACASSVS